MPTDVETKNRTALLLGAVTVAAGAVAVGYFMTKKWKDADSDPVSVPHTISETISECYDKMEEIQLKLKLHVL